MLPRLNSRIFSHGILCGAIVAQVLGTELCAQGLPPAPPTRTPPTLPTAKSPIEYFRELLAMSVFERERSIATRSDEQKKILRAKLAEYEAMTAEEREVRLAVTELRWHLVPLMRTAPADRGERVQKIPEDQRALVQDRLQRWDKLSAAQQSEFLESEMTVNYFLRLQTRSPEEQTNLLQAVPGEFRQKLERELERWNALPAGDRDRMSQRFEEFFELNSTEKQKTLGTLSQAERAQMEKTLRNFQTLTAEQRRHCIKSFDKLAEMNWRERMQFLQKAEAWEKMSPTDRKSWRDLVQTLPQMPPLPPGMKLTPPLPSALVATNLSN